MLRFFLGDQIFKEGLHVSLLRAYKSIAKTVFFVIRIKIHSPKELCCRYTLYKMCLYNCSYKTIRKNNIIVNVITIINMSKYKLRAIAIYMFNKTN